MTQTVQATAQLTWHGNIVAAGCRPRHLERLTPALPVGRTKRGLAELCSLERLHVYGFAADRRLLLAVLVFARAATSTV